MFLIFCSPNNRADRNFHDLIRAGASGHLLAFAVAAVFRLDDRLIEKIGKVIHVAIRTQDHIAATSTIATVRSAFRHKLLPSKTHATASALSSLGKNFDPIYEHGAVNVPLAPGRVTPMWANWKSGFCLSCERGSTEMHLERLTGNNNPFIRLPS